MLVVNNKPLQYNNKFLKYGSVPYRANWEFITFSSYSELQSRFTNFPDLTFRLDVSFSSDGQYHEDPGGHWWDVYGYYNEEDQHKTIFLDGLAMQSTTLQNTIITGTFDSYYVNDPSQLFTYNLKRYDGNANPCFDWKIDNITGHLNSDPSVYPYYAPSYEGLDFSPLASGDWYSPDFYSTIPQQTDIPFEELSSYNDICSKFYLSPGHYWYGIEDSATVNDSNVKFIYSGTITDFWCNSPDVYSAIIDLNKHQHKADPYNPLNLPPYTIRLEYNEGETPFFDKGVGTQVSQSPNIWDLTYNDTDWNHLLNYQVNLKNVLGANTTNVTNMDYMFNGCVSLSSIPLFNTTNVSSMEDFVGYSNITGFPQLDTSNVVNMNSMFEHCFNIGVIPNLNTNKVKTVDSMFAYCYYITGGILDFYNQLTGQPEPPSSHVETFYHCGENTETGEAELAQIPDDWK